MNTECQFLEFASLGSVSVVNRKRVHRKSKGSQANLIEKASHTPQPYANKVNSKTQAVPQLTSHSRIAFNKKRSSSIITVFNTLLPESLKSPPKCLRRSSKPPVYKIVPFNVNAVGHMLDRKVRNDMLNERPASSIYSQRTSKGHISRSLKSIKVLTAEGKDHLVSIVSSVDNDKGCSTTEFSSPSKRRDLGKRKATLSYLYH
eukprot:TRINITY_DN4931_c0_g1_i12.p1 TRINITY_DN4931_c0_g1~~TRINITY_DN4931_c0_g1_i12.p1  ORF type:complete len:203 (+),score=31.82 TRINITY_DN4931_c0_g1_i12:216-824(+)